MSVFDILGQRVWSPSCLSSQAFSNSVHYFLTSCALIVPSVLSVGGEFFGGKCFTHRKWITFMNIFMLSSFQRHCDCTAPFLQFSTWLTDWLTHSCTICCMLPSYKCCFLPKNKMLYSHSNCWLGNLTYWTCPIFRRSWLQFELSLQSTNLSKYSILTVMIVWAMSSRLSWKQCRRMVRSVRGVRGTGSVVAVGYSAVMQNSILVVVILP